jgi:hypothetical protein
MLKSQVSYLYLGLVILGRRQFPTPEPCVQAVTGIQLIHLYKAMALTTILSIPTATSCLGLSLPQAETVTIAFQLAFGVHPSHSCHINLAKNILPYNLPVQNTFSGS